MLVELVLLVVPPSVPVELVEVVVDPPVLVVVLPVVEVVAAVPPVPVPVEPFEPQFAVAAITSPRPMLDSTAALRRENENICIAFNSCARSVRT